MLYVLFLFRNTVINPGSFRNSKLESKMATSSCARCLHAFQKIQARIKIVHPLQVIQTRNLSNEPKVPPNILNSRAHEFSGQKAALFDNPEVQNLLRKMTGLDVNVVFKPRKELLQNPIYKVLDKEELEKEEGNALKEADKRLEMPPVMSQRKPIRVIIAKHPELIKHDEEGADYVFTDISMSHDARTRPVLVRENDTGILREATWDERDRMQFIYWPKEGQHHELVPMLQDEHLPYVFDDLRHEDVLDFINIQCEPDSPDYIRVHQRVYDDLEQRQQYDVLYSTRHFGGMAFYYVTNNKTNNFLSFLLRNGRVEDGIQLMKLHAIIYPDSAFANTVKKDGDDIDLIKKYLLEEGMQNLMEYLQPDVYADSKE